VTSHIDWHLGDALMRGCGEAGHVAGMVEDWWDMCLGRAGYARGAILKTHGG
jgi:hypothetical protein